MHFFKKISAYFKAHESQLWLAGIIFLSILLAFAAGYLTAQYSHHPSIQIYDYPTDVID